MSTQIQRHLFTIADYHKMGEIGILPERGFELINGEIIKKPPIKSQHAAKVNKLNSLFYGSVQPAVGSKTCDRRACSRSEHFRIDERPRSGW